MTLANSYNVAIVTDRYWVKMAVNTYGARVVSRVAGEVGKTLHFSGLAGCLKASLL
jgi:hypothetical protein